jgi:hypothetical protein
VSREGSTSSFFATAVKIRSRSRPAAWIAALPAISVTREEYEPRSTGVRSVSAGCTRMSLGSMPSTSATRYARIESDPWPMSVAPQSTAISPLRSARTTTPECGMSFQ